MGSAVVGCSDTVSTQPAANAVESYASEAARPNCDAAHNLEVAYAEAEKSLSLCAGGVWMPVGSQTAAGGTAGATGASGATGTNGTDGTNGSNGATGSAGSAGTNGTNGGTGATGSAGTNGANGATGGTGATGSAGTNGTNGATGATGSAGTNGTNGASGATGSAGANGATTRVVVSTEAAGANCANGGFKLVFYVDANASTTMDGSESSTAQTAYACNAPPPVSTPGNVSSNTGRIWQDRNLGAAQVATSSTDAASYGDLYQWGRGADGHQSRSALSTFTLSSSVSPGHDLYIINRNPNYDWLSPQNANLWQGVGGVNNPCSSGFRLPTDAEWAAEIASWSSQNAAGAFASPLKLPLAGYRYTHTDALTNVGTYGHYWTSSSNANYSWAYDIDGSSAVKNSYGRVDARSVRCIKD